MSQKRLLALVGVVAIFASACGGPQASAPPAASVDPGASAPAASATAEPSGNLAAEQILNIDLAGEPPTLDPNKAQDANSLTVLRALHRPLVYIDKDLKVVPALAEKFEVSADAKTLTFTLRDAKYSNGDAIVAADLVYSWKRLVDPRTAAPYAYVMDEVAGGTDLLDMAAAKPLPPDADIEAALDKFGVAAPDEKTFVVTLGRPATYFLAAMTLWVGVPVQEKWITSTGATEAANYVSSGPFMLDTWDHNSEIVLKPNPNWYGDVKPTLTEIHMSMNVDAAARQAAYEAGQVDANMPVPAADVPRIKADPVLGAEFTAQSQLDIVYYNFNNKDGPTANKNFRIALTQAIDKQALLVATYAGLGEVANGFIMPGLPGYDEALNPYPFDLAAAKVSMDKALVELGIASAAEIPTIKFGYNTESDHDLRVNFMAEAWRQAFGLETEQIGSEFSVFLTQRHDGLYGIARNGWGADYPHANNQLSGLHTCGGGNNDQQYCNPAFDELLVKAAAEADQAAQAEIYKEAMTLMMADAPFIPLVHRATPILIKPYVTGVTGTPMDSTVPGEHFFETIKILEH